MLKLFSSRKVIKNKLSIFKLSFNIMGSSNSQPKKDTNETQQSIFDFEVDSITNNKISLSNFKGKK